VRVVPSPLLRFPSHSCVLTLPHSARCGSRSQASGPDRARRCQQQQQHRQQPQPQAPQAQHQGVRLLLATQALRRGQPADRGAGARGHECGRGRSSRLRRRPRFAGSNSSSALQPSQLTFAILACADEWSTIFGRGLYLLNPARYSCPVCGECGSLNNFCGCAAAAGLLCGCAAVLLAVLLCCCSAVLLCCRSVVSSSLRYEPDANSAQTRVIVDYLAFAGVQQESGLPAFRSEGLQPYRAPLNRLIADHEGVLELSLQPQLDDEGLTYLVPSELDERMRAAVTRARRLQRQEELLEDRAAEEQEDTEMEDRQQQQLSEEAMLLVSAADDDDAASAAAAAGGGGDCGKSEAKCESDDEEAAALEESEVILQQAAVVREPDNAASGAAAGRSRRLTSAPSRLRDFAC
jgi:hypothetical protein